MLRLLQSLIPVGITSSPDPPPEGHLNSFDHQDNTFTLSVPLFVDITNYATTMDVKASLSAQTGISLDFTDRYYRPTF